MIQKDSSQARCEISAKSSHSSKRGGEGAELKDRVHAVWYAVFGRVKNNSNIKLCIRVPYVGDRVFEKGDEEFLQLRLKGVLQL